MIHDTMVRFHIDGLLEAHNSCLSLDTRPPPDDGQPYCEVYWDTWGCWDYTLNGTTAEIDCPWYIQEFDPSLRATRECDSTGNWHFYPEANGSWSNYSRCINTNEMEWHKTEIYMYVSGYVISIAALLVSLVIFFYFKQLQCDRITLHKQLFISYILNGIVWIPYYTEVAMKAETLESNPVWCQALHVLTQYFVTCNFFWMFCEGLYLHTIVVVAFMSGKKLVIICYIVGWVLPLVITLVYTVLREMDDLASSGCWLGDSHLVWIVFGPIVLTLLTNVAFLCNIVRVLITKMRAVNSPDTNQTRKAVRATVILIPLLGLQFILFPFAPESGTLLYKVYSLSSAFVTSFQGFFVALIFCFLNGEVISIIKRKWGQHRLMHGKRAASFYSQTTFTMAETSTVNHASNYDNSHCADDRF